MGKLRDKADTLIKEQEEARRYSGIRMTSFRPTPAREWPRHESQREQWQNLFRKEFYGEVLALLVLKAGISEGEIENVADNVFSRLDERKDDCLLASGVVGQFVEFMHQNSENNASISETHMLDDREASKD